MKQIVYLNGEFCDLADAKISVLDRGFIFGDGIYEVIPVYQGKLFRAQHHLARLARSLDYVGISNLYTEAEWLALIQQLLARQPEGDQMVYLQVTRGVAKRAHAFPKEVTPTIFMMSNPLPQVPATLREQGVSCVSMDDLRWLRCQIKSTSLLGNVLAAEYAAEHEAIETIQFRDGYLTEASSSNVWLVKDGVLYAPPKDNLILEGIRYGLFEELAAALGITLIQKKLTKADLLAADELLLSSATKEVLAVVNVDDQTIGNGRPGPIYHSLYAAYQAAKAAAT